MSGVDKYRVFAWRSRLLALLKYLEGDVVWDLLDVSPGDLARRIKERHPATYQEWLIKFPGATIEHLDTLGNHPDEKFQKPSAKRATETTNSNQEE